MIKNRFEFYNLSYAVISFSFLLYFWIILKYTSYMPIEDDYSTVLAFLNSYLTPDTTMLQKLKMLFHLNAEHRLVFANAIILAQYYLFDQANFLYLVLIGNLGWLLTIYLLWKYSTKKNDISITAFAPVVLIMLSFSHASLMTWATGSLQQYWQLFFALFSIWLLTNKYTLQAFIFMTIAIFTGGGGMVLIPIFFLYFLMHKSWKHLAIFSILSLLIVLFYFVVLDYKSLDRNIYLLIDKPLDAILFLLTFLGNFGTSYPLAAYIGGVLILAYLWIFKFLFKHMSFIAWSILYIIMTAFLVSVIRFEQGLTFALPSRYSIYSISFLALIYIGYIKRYQYNTNMYILGFVVGLSIFVFHFIHKLPAFEQRKYVAETSLAFPTKGYAEKVLKESLKSNTFTLWIGNRPPSFLLGLPKIESTSYCQVNVLKHNNIYNSTTKNSAPINIFPQERLILLDGWAFDHINNSRAYGVILKLNDRQGFFYLDRYKKSSKTLFNQEYPHNGFQIPIEVSHLSSGSHSLDINVVNTFATAYYEAFTIPIHKLDQEEVNKLPVEDENFIGSIDKVLYKQNKFRMTGWLLSNNKSAINEPVLIDIDGKRYTANSRISRPDVSMSYKDPSTLHSGFILDIPHITFSKGVHKITVLVSEKNRKSLLNTELYSKFEVR